MFRKYRILMTSKAYSLGAKHVFGSPSFTVTSGINIKITASAAKELSLVRYFNAVDGAILIADSRPDIIRLIQDV